MNKIKKLNRRTFKNRKLINNKMKIQKIQIKFKIIKKQRRMKTLKLIIFKKNQYNSK